MRIVNIKVTVRTNPRSGIVISKQFPFKMDFMQRTSWICSKRINGLNIGQTKALTSFEKGPLTANLSFLFIIVNFI